MVVLGTERYSQILVFLEFWISLISFSLVCKRPDLLTSVLLAIRPSLLKKTCFCTLTLKNIMKKSKSIKVYETGILSTGKKWELVRSRESSVPKGDHLVAHPVNDEKLDNRKKRPVFITEDEEMLVTAYRLNQKYAIKNDDYRFAKNGPETGNLSTWHAHCICPNGDEMIRLVAPPKKTK